MAIAPGGFQSRTAARKPSAPKLYRTGAQIHDQLGKSPSRLLVALGTNAAASVLATEAMAVAGFSQPIPTRGDFLSQGFAILWRWFHCFWALRVSPPARAGHTDFS